MNDFKLNFFFMIHKDKPLPNRDEFRRTFTKKYGKFQYLEELIRMIEKYQFKKYGATLNNFVEVRTHEERRYLQTKANARKWARLRK